MLPQSMRVLTRTARGRRGTDGHPRALADISRCQPFVSKAKRIRGVTFCQPCWRASGEDAGPVREPACTVKSLCCWKVHPGSEPKTALESFVSPPFSPDSASGTTWNRSSVPMEFL